MKRIPRKPLPPDHKCDSCGGLLVLPSVAWWFNAPEGAASICLQCGRPYRWVGHPPRLMTFFLK